MTRRIPEAAQTELRAYGIIASTQRFTGEKRDRIVERAKLSSQTEDGFYTGVSGGRVFEGHAAVGSQTAGEPRGKEKRRLRRSRHSTILPTMYPGLRRQGPDMGNAKERDSPALCGDLCGNMIRGVCRNSVSAGSVWPRWCGIFQVIGG